MSSCWGDYIGVIMAENWRVDRRTFPTRCGRWRLGFGTYAAYTMGLLNLSTGVVALVLRRRDDVRAEAAPLVFDFFCADCALVSSCSWL